MVAILLLKKKKVIMLGLRKPVRQLMQPVRERYIYIYSVTDTNTRQGLL